MVAAAKLGVVLERTALIPFPEAADRIVGMLLGGFDIASAACPSGVAAPARARWVARAHRSGTVLTPFCCRPESVAWRGADLTLSTWRPRRHGTGVGRGRLCARELTVVVSGVVRQAGRARPRLGCLVTRRGRAHQPRWYGRHVRRCGSRTGMHSVLSHVRSGCATTDYTVYGELSPCLGGAAG
jgi:hypothetical protein